MASLKQDRGLELRMVKLFLLMLLIYLPTASQESLLLSSHGRAGNQRRKLRKSGEKEGERLHQLQHFLCPRSAERHPWVMGRYRNPSVILWTGGCTSAKEKSFIFISFPSLGIISGVWTKGPWTPFKEPRTVVFCALSDGMCRPH